MTIPYRVNGVDAHRSMYLPRKAHATDAGFDLFSSVKRCIKPGERASIPTNFAMAIPDGYVGLVVSRSGLAINHGITVLNSPGIIDSGYRGEIMAILLNTDPTEDFLVSVGDRIAQLLIMPVPNARFEFLMDDEFFALKSDRGDGGFGSTGR